MYKFFLTVHVWASSLFVVIAFIVLIRSIIAVTKKKKYFPYDKKLSTAYLIFLYAGFALGIVLYFFLHPKNHQVTNIDEARKFASLRFWAIEHLTVMLFALILAQIGRIFTKYQIPDFDKHKYTLFYFGISILITFISLTLFMVYR